MERRHFLNRLPLLTSIPLIYGSGISPQLDSLHEIVDRLAALDPGDEKYWWTVREAYDMSLKQLDFNNAGVGTPCLQVFNAFFEESKKFQQLPSKRGNQLRKIRKECVTSLAVLSGCQTSEIALCRNATEALASSIFGLPLQAGDEVVLGQYDYPHIYYAWKQRERRDGIILKYADFGACPKTPKAIEKAYVNLVTNKTKAIQITDLINYNGCRVPTREIISQLPMHVRYRIVDAAQSYANTIENIADFGATHVGVSLHKWLGAPLGTGMLYIQEDYIEETWPLYAATVGEEKAISKFEHHGTLNTAVYPGILAAIAFHQKIGFNRKSKRLMQLGDYFVENMKSLPMFSIQSPRHDQLKSNLILISHKSLTNSELHSKLWIDHSIHVTTSDWMDVSGVRISPNVFTVKDDVDTLIKVLSKLS